MNINSAFPSKYLKASDLGGRTVTVTVKDVKMEQVGQSRDIKPVVYFEGKEKGLVLNKTNSNKIANIAGSGETDDWTGTQIQIYPTETEFSGETVDCIRVRPVRGPRQLSTAAPAEPDSFESADPPPAPPAASRPVAVAAAAGAGVHQQRAAAAAPITDDDIPF
jgi:hypothetical protein